MTHQSTSAALLPDTRHSLGIHVGVTGASGFIGRRLVEMLRAATRSGNDDEVRTFTPRVLARGWTDADGRTVDLRDSGSVQGAIAGCDAVVHCAFDFTDLEANRAIARAVGSACATLGIRLVHISTAAVYEPFPNGPLDETGGSEGPGSDYKQIKLAIEAELTGLVRDSGLDLVILQPTIVYGAGGRAWTDSPIRELLTGTVVLPEDGEGLCNAVHVDDVCRAAIAAVGVPIGTAVKSGERFLVSGPSPVTWRAFYGAYQAMLGIDALKLVSAAACPHSAEAKAVTTPSGMARTPSGRGRLKLVATLLIGARALSRLNFAVNFGRSLVLGGALHVPSGPKLALFRSHCTVRTDKARTMLGYAPQLDLEQGMRMTEPYVRATYGRLARLRRR